MILITMTVMKKDIHDVIKKRLISSRHDLLK